MRPKTACETISVSTEAVDSLTDILNSQRLRPTRWHRRTQVLRHWYFVQTSLFVCLSDLIDTEARMHLLVGVDNKLLLQDLVDVFQPPQVLYEDSNRSVTVAGISHYIRWFA